VKTQAQEQANPAQTVLVRPASINRFTMMVMMVVVMLVVISFRLMFLLDRSVLVKLKHANQEKHDQQADQARPSREIVGLGFNQ